MLSIYSRAVGAGVDFEDERFVDPEYLSEHRARTLWPTAGNNEHPALMVATHGQRAAIDRELAELVYLTWRWGIQTGQSCRGYEGEDSYIVFLGEGAADEFRDVVPSSRMWLWEEDEDDYGEPSDEWVATFPLRDVQAAVAELRANEQRWSKPPE